MCKNLRKEQVEHYWSINGAQSIFRCSNKERLKIYTNFFV